MEVKLAYRGSTMYLRKSYRPWCVSTRTAAQARALASSEGGATAIEFALVIGPFLFLLFGIISLGFYWFNIFSLEHAVESAARVIRTGQAQTQTPNPMTVAQFKALICAKLPPYMPCGSSD